jgi:hypothetical protein
VLSDDEVEPPGRDPAADAADADAPTPRGHQPDLGPVEARIEEQQQQQQQMQGAWPC